MVPPPKALAVLLVLGATGCAARGRVTGDTTGSVLLRLNLEPGKVHAYRNTDRVGSESPGSAPRWPDPAVHTGFRMKPIASAGDGSATADFMTYRAVEGAHPSTHRQARCRSRVVPARLAPVDETSCRGLTWLGPWWHLPERPIAVGAFWESTFSFQLKGIGIAGWKDQHLAVPVRLTLRGVEPRQHHRCAVISGQGDARLTQEIEKPKTGFSIHLTVRTDSCFDVQRGRWVSGKVVARAEVKVTHGLRPGEPEKGTVIFSSEWIPLPGWENLPEDAPAPPGH